MPRFVMLVGVPGSGKSTYARKLVEQGPSYAIVSRDDILTNTYSNLTYSEAFKQANHKQIDEALNIRLQMLLDLNKDIIVDMTNLTKASRKRTLDKVDKEYDKFCIYFPIDNKTMFERAEARVSEGKVIPKNVLDDMMNRLEVPAPDEGFICVGYIHG